MTFVKGQSGNPSGRPKRTRSGQKTITQLAREASEDAINCLVEVMKSEKSTMTAKAIAADKILDRAWGKAPQAVAVIGALAIRKASELSDDELAAIIREKSNEIKGLAHQSAANDSDGKETLELTAVADEDEPPESVE